MMDYNELANQELTLGDPFRGARKLRPLFPRPYLPPPNHSVNTTCFSGFHGSTNHLLSLNNTTRNQHHHFVMGPEESKVETVGTNQVMVSSRWNPTPEQLRALEDLYRRGTRTPSADQIQHITTQLRRYGKIEGKNVFYWFQNHKARERQKRRRQLQLPPPPQPQPQHSSEKTSSNEEDKIGIESEPKSCKWTTSSTNKESDPPIQLTEARIDVTKGDTTTTTSEHEWIQLFHKTPHFQHHHHITNDHTHNNITNINNLFLAKQKNATWQTHHHNNNHKNYNTMVQQQPSSCSLACCYPSPFPFSPSSKLPSITPKDAYRSPEKQVLDGDHDVVETPPQSPTLQLFPVTLVRKDHDQVHYDISLDDDMMNKVENEEKEKNSSSICIINECNNPFPFYQFI